MTYQMSDKLDSRQISARREKKMNSGKRGVAGCFR